MGVEAALYARFLGYAVQVLEQGRVGERLRLHRSEAPPMLIKNCCSPLGLRALLAQDPRWPPPELEASWTAEQYVVNYLMPLTRTDLLDGVLREHTRVIDVVRTEPAEVDAGAEIDNADAEPLEELEEGWVYVDEPPRLPPLRVSVRQWSSTAESQVSNTASPAHYDADIVIDASGCNVDGPDYRFLQHLRLDSASQAVGSVAGLVLAEPNFYFLGSKKHGNAHNFMILEGLRQVRDLFALIGGRAGLDLYQSPSPTQ